MEEVLELIVCVLCGIVEGVSDSWDSWHPFGHRRDRKKKNFSGS